MAKEELDKLAAAWKCVTPYTTALEIDMDCPLTGQELYELVQKLIDTHDDG